MRIYNRVANCSKHLQVAEGRAAFCASILDPAAIIEQSADALIVADREGLIRVWNAAATQLFGFTADDHAVTIITGA